MHLFHIPQCTIQNRNVHISVLNDALWDMEQMHCGICEFGLFTCREGVMNRFTLSQSLVCNVPSWSGCREAGLNMHGCQYCRVFGFTCTHSFLTKIPRRMKPDRIYCFFPLRNSNIIGKKVTPRLINAQFWNWIRIFYFSFLNFFVWV